LHASEPDCEVSRYNSYYEVREGKLAQTDTLIIQINNRSGEDHCQIEIPFSKTDPIIQFAAWIEDNNGSVIRKLRKQEYTDVNAIADYSLYEDDFSRRFLLKHNVYPYRICYTYKIVYRQFLSIANWYPILETDVPTRQAKLVFESPQDYTINVIEKNIGAPEIKQIEKRIIRTWNTSYDGSLKSEVFCPLLSGFLPSVSIVPLQFDYGCKGSTADWKSFGKWQSDLNDGLGNLPENERLKISGLIGQTRDKKEIARILYHYLQDNTRYVNVTLDIGGMKPYPAEYVSVNKYGDCKALTNYMKALLGCAGVESYYTTVHSNRQPKQINVAVPSQQFNHVVLAIPLEKDTIWLENTNNSNPFGYTSTFIQNRVALLVDHDSSRLIRIPSLQDSDVRETEKMEFFFDTGDNAKATICYDFKGNKFELYNSLITQNNRDEQDTYIHDHLPFSSFEIHEWKIFKRDRDARNIRLEACISIHNMLKSLGADRYFMVVPLAIPEFSAPKTRKLPVQLPFPIVVSDTIIYHVSSYYNKIMLPADTTLESKFGRYQVSFKREGINITVFRDFLLHPGTISLREYNSFYSFLAAIRKDESQKILIQRK
jgi:hypothetical protein